MSLFLKKSQLNEGAGSHAAQFVVLKEVLSLMSFRGK